MIKHKEQRVGILVDVSNMYHSAKNLYSRKVNFKEILIKAVAGRKLIRATAYVIRTENKDEMAFFEALSQQGFEVKMKDLQI
ncbi:MAG: NYN domain-containing protein, partial [Candidatus Omnitrophota bacterium]